METIDGGLMARAKAGEIDVIIHGRNCFCTMGAGIARGIEQEFSAAFDADRGTGKNAREKRGRRTAAGRLYQRSLVRNRLGRTTPSYGTNRRL